MTESYPDEKPKFLERYCFGTAWIDVLLKNMGFAPTSDALVLTDRVGEFEIGWTLGAAICSMTGCFQPS